MGAIYPEGRPILGGEQRSFRVDRVEVGGLGMHHLEGLPEQGLSLESDLQIVLRDLAGGVVLDQQGAAGQEGVLIVGLTVLQEGTYFNTGGEQVDWLALVVLGL